MRLRRNGDDFLTKLHEKFQSHCGAIATSESERAGVVRSLFQSHCGAIATVKATL
ncbi:MAG: hypothetical protein RMK94_17605 [Armatimonadota bacterium]|nr:hypothetical protein [Armatimonadota bacterium]